MGGFTVTRNYDAPVERVFGVFGDIPNAADNVGVITKVEMLTDGKVGAGTRWRETRLMRGRASTMELGVTDWKPNESYTVECEAGNTLWVTRFEFRPKDGGTEVALVIEWHPKGFLARIMCGLVSGMMKKGMTQDLEDLAGAVAKAG